MVSTFSWKPGIQLDSKEENITPEGNLRKAMYNHVKDLKLPDLINLNLFGILLAFMAISVKYVEFFSATK